MKLHIGVDSQAGWRSAVVMAANAHDTPPQSAGMAMSWRVYGDLAYASQKTP